MCLWFLLFVSNKSLIINYLCVTGTSFTSLSLVNSLTANQRDSTVQEKGFKRKDQRYKQGNGEELEFIELLVAQANKDELISYM